jgi:multiple sugar transport system substrate-binding protein
MKTLKGLTWDHPRGHRPLRAWAREDRSVDVRWDIQKLERFESHPIHELAERYDLLIVDHPGIGEAAEKQCIRPLEDFLTDEQSVFLQASSIGSTFESYQYGGRHWAIPIDAAAQVCALAGGAVIAGLTTWDGIRRYSQNNEGSVALSLGGPHALLTFYSICQSMDGELFSENDLVVSRDVAINALAVMQGIYSRQQKELVDLNPIRLLDEMARGQFDVCPAIFGYVNYATRESGRAIRFTNIPHCGSPDLRGSVLGGTGMAISVSCKPTPELIAHIMRYVSDEVQSSLVVENAGQPSNTVAWRNDRANVLTQNFFRDTFATVSSAFVRPKYHGYIPFQDSSSAIIREGLIQQKRVDEIFDAIKENHGRFYP